MAGRQLAPLILSDDERSELKSLARRRKTAQAVCTENPIRVYRAIESANLA
jgi:hypothetical protein